MPNHKQATDKRKAEHIDIVLNRDVEGKSITTGLERYRFRHQALPEVDFDDIDLSTSFLGHHLKAPFLVSSMTGGTEEAGQINRNLAQAAEARGWALGLGSGRAAVEHPELARTFDVRSHAPTIPILANLGAVQLNYGYGIAECQRVVELTQADALILHLNSMQEVFQPEGNTRFSRLLEKIEAICSKLEVPVGVKEVGMGIDGDTACRLWDAGAAFIDVAGAGGTSWIQVEKYRSPDPLVRQAAEAFRDWGLPTAACIREARTLKRDTPLIASGGLLDGVDGAKCLALGANLAGFGRSLLHAAVQPTPEAISRQLEQIEWECKTAMFGIGVTDMKGLQETERLVEI
ncbi:type 2 isopentenyl-diphosphate Delta-isomerase [Desmospora profundinema]|uniref:Isopentenyl-diphosphate delta-isomerase n=1 Tax=Desmospora profundinema TaxID=1571184 RepID=A0ABU1IR60_9BACL|nr:type 2 isopentenyl-diphosphate Delta-isomerase [Desmospora profundinema]MDR6226908.1 isopentenyl-diphosphate delta-isomerase [Desmospora profundinema]